MNASEPFDLPEWFRRQNFEQRIYSNKKLSKWKLVLRAESSVHIFFIPSSYSSSSLAYQPKEWTSFFVGHRAHPIDTLSHHCALYLVPKLHLPSLEATRELLAPIHILYLAVSSPSYVARPLPLFQHCLTLYSGTLIYYCIFFNNI